MLKTLLVPCSIIRVQTWDGETPAPWTVEQVLGIAWRGKTGGAVAGGDVDVICVGPTDWLVVAADPNAATLLRRLEQAFEGSAFRATNVSHALARIQIDGPQARTLLSKGCALDLHPPLFSPGRSARTRVAGMPVIVRCTRTSTFECIVTMSHADYIFSWFTDSALEFATAP